MLVAACDEFRVILSEFRWERVKHVLRQASGEVEPAGPQARSRAGGLLVEIMAVTS